MSLEETSFQFIACANRDLIELSDALYSSANELKKKQKKCHSTAIIKNIDLEAREEIFLDEITSRADLVELLNHALQRASLAIRGAELLEKAIDYADTTLEGATRFLSCNFCQKHFFGEVEVKSHHHMYHGHIPFVESKINITKHEGDTVETDTKVLRDDSAHIWKAAENELDTQYTRDYKTVLRLKRRSVSNTISTLKSNTREQLIKEAEKWNVDPFRWHSSMLYNTKLTLNLLLAEQEELGNWQVSSGLADLMFCTPYQLRKNALSLFKIPYYTPVTKTKPGSRSKYANVGDVMINFLCTASAVFHLNYILETIDKYIRKSIIKKTKLAIAAGIQWMKRCAPSKNYGGASRVFSWVSRNQQHWPSIRDDDYACKVHVTMIQSVGFTTCDRTFCTKISRTTPIQSILMLLNCHFDVQYNYLQAYAPCEIVVRDKRQNYIIFDQLNQTANKMMSSILNEQRARTGSKYLEIEVMFRTVDNQKYPRFRECLPTQIAIEGIEDRHIVQNVEIAIPQGATLYHLRQIISDEMSTITDIDNKNKSNIDNEEKKKIEGFKNSASDATAAREKEKKRKERFEAEEKLHYLFLQRKSEERRKEIKKEYGTDKVEVIMSRSKKAFQGSSLEWMKSRDYSRAQDKAMRLEIDLKEVTEFLENTPFIFSSDEEDNVECSNDDYYSDKKDGNWKNTEHRPKTSKLGPEELASLVTSGPSSNPSNTHKSFSFVHRGLYLLPDEEAGVLALDSAIHNGSMGMTSQMEQQSRLVILLQPATGIDFGIDDDDEFRDFKETD